MNFIEAEVKKMSVASFIQRNTIDFHKKSWSFSTEGSCSKKSKIFLNST